MSKAATGVKCHATNGEAPPRARRDVCIRRAHMPAVLLPGRRALAGVKVVAVDTITIDARRSLR